MATENQTNEYDPQAVAMVRAIKVQESGNNYNAPAEQAGQSLGGAYQYQAPTWKSYAKEVLGDENAPFSPENQDKVTYGMVKKWKDAGLQPDQIAHNWNPGDPAYPGKVVGHLRNIAGQMKTKAPQQTIEQQKEGMVEQGQPVSVKEDRVQPTFAGKIARGILKTPARLGLNVIGALETIFSPQEAEKLAKEGLDTKYFGNLKPIGTSGNFGQNLKESIGAGLEMASYLPAGGAVGTATKGIKAGKILKTAAKTGLEGAAAGTLAGSGQALAEGEGIGKALERGLIGGAFGGATGGVLGGGGAALAKGIGGISSLAKATGVVAPTADDAAKAIQSVAEEYERAAGTGLPNSFRKRQATRTGDLKPWSQTLSEYGIVPEEGIDKNWDVEKALGDIDALNDEFGKTKANYVKNENAMFNVDEMLDNAFQKIDQSSKSELSRKAAKTRLMQEVDAALGKGVPLDAQGKRIVRADTMERLRDIGYELTPFNASDPQKIGQSAGYSLAKAVNEQIDKQGTFPAYRAFNREWSNILNAQEALNQLSTKKVRLSKGLSGQIALKTLAPIFGYSKGGIIGAILSDLGGEAVGKLLSDPQLRTIVQRSIITKAGQKLPKEQIIADLEKEIAEYAATQASLPQLPAAGKSSAPMMGTGEIKTPQSIRQEQSAMQAGREMFKRQGLLKDKGETPKLSLKDQRGFISTGFKNEGDLTTKILKDLEGKTTVSKQYILDATNRGELKQAERDITRQVLDSMKGDTVNVKEFADKVKSELLPLKVKSTSIDDMRYRGDPNKPAPKYENITLPNELRGKVKNYKENIYESPIKTSAGQTHFGYQTDSYFGHTRIEDMADNKTRRVIEVQSDLYQKGNLEREGLGYKNVAEYNKDYPDQNFGKADRQKIQDMQKLAQYNDPTAHFRMVREEIKKASQDGKTKLQFPTGETAMKIEGLAGQGNDNFLHYEDSTNLKPKDLEFGQKFNDRRYRGSGIGNFIVLDKTGNETFNAIHLKADAPDILHEGNYGDFSKEYKDALKKYVAQNKSLVENFSIAEKIDTNNPIYKFYEKDVAKYLNKFGGKRIVDNKGVSWIEIPITKEQGKAPVEAFGKIKSSPLFIGAGAGLAGTIGAGLLKKRTSNQNK